MRFHFSEFVQISEIFFKIAKALASGIIFVGIAGIVTYFIRIGYSPQSLSVGDGLLFFIAAASFCLVYYLYLACMFILAINIAPFFVRPIFWILSKITKPKKESVYTFAPFRWWAVILGIAAFLSFVFVIKPKLWWTALPAQIIIYICYSAYLSIEEKIKETELILDFGVIYEKEINFLQKEIENFKKDRILLLTMGFIIAPLLAVKIIGQLQDISMCIANIRIEKSIVYIKKPYSALLPESLKLEKSKYVDEFTAFDNIKILFKGYGTTTLISFSDGNKIKNLEIQNGSLIVEKNGRRQCLDLP